MSRPLNLLLVCEGDAETSTGSFSGVTNSVLRALRSAGHRVECADVDLYGARRLAGAVREFSPKRARWSTRFRLKPFPAALRSRIAQRAVASRRDRLDAVLQVGATFELGADCPVPYFLYCDSNIRMAMHGAGSGHSNARWLSEAELALVVARESRVYAGAAGIFTLSERLRRSFIEDFGIAPERVEAAGAGPNFDTADIPDRLDEFRQGPPEVLFIGVQFARKGGDALLRAFARARAEVPDARLTVVGPREPIPEAPGVEWLGFLDKDVSGDRARLDAAFRRARLFCLPTRYEPFGIAYLEAMYYALPCVGTRTGAVGEMIADGRTGFLVEVDDEAAMADRLVRLLRDPALAREMGLAGRQRARERYSWAFVATCMAQRIAGAARPPAVLEASAS